MNGRKTVTVQLHMQVFDDRHGDGVTPNNAFLEENLDTIDQWMALFQAFKKTRVSIIFIK